MLADSGAGLVITDTKNLPLVAQLARGELPAVNVDELDEGLAGDNLDVHPSPDALAMLLYTSGSTGNPKGVMHSHRNVLAEVRNLTNAWCVELAGPLVALYLASASPIRSARSTARC